MMTFSTSVKDDNGRIGTSISYSLHNEWLDVHDAVSGFKMFLLAAGFHPESVANALGEDDARLE